jgi:hypothetical protein
MLSFIPWWGWLLVTLAFWFLRLLVRNKDNYRLIRILLIIAMSLSAAMAVIRFAKRAWAGDGAIRLSCLLKASEGAHGLLRFKKTSKSNIGLTLGPELSGMCRRRHYWNCFCRSLGQALIASASRVLVPQRTITPLPKRAQIRRPFRALKTLYTCTFAFQQLT